MRDKQVKLTVDHFVLQKVTLAVCSLLKETKAEFYTPPGPSFDASAELFAELLPTSHNVAAGVFTKRLGGDRRQRPPPSSHPDPRIHPAPHTYHQSSQLGGGRRTGLLPSASCCAANARR